MLRRTFAQLLSSLPLFGWLKPQNKEFKWNFESIKWYEMDWGEVSKPTGWKKKCGILYKYVDFPQEFSVCVVFKNEPDLMYCFTGFNILNWEQCRQNEFNMYEPFTQFEILKALSDWPGLDPKGSVVKGLLDPSMKIKLRDNKELCLSYIQMGGFNAKS